MYANENKVSHIARAVDELKAEIGSVKSDLVELTDILRDVADRGFYADYRNWLSARAALGMELPVMNEEFAYQQFNFDRLFGKATVASKIAAAEEIQKNTPQPGDFSKILETHNDWIANPVEINCGAGWTDLITRAFAIIAATVRPVGQKVTIVQLQERMGALCLRVMTAKLTDQVGARLDSVTNAVANESRTICETCGKPGRMYARPYRAVRCEQHAAEEARS
jgi:hypothetical protein